MKPQPMEYIRLKDLVEASNLHYSTVERYVFQDILLPDATVIHGRTFRPIFLKSKLKEHLANIKRYRDSLEKETVGSKN
jgi:hypothetical protein